MQRAAIFISASENTKLLLQVFLYQAEQFAWTKLTDIGMHESCKTNKILQAYIFEQESQESYLKWASIILVKKILQACNFKNNYKRKHEFCVFLVIWTPNTCICMYLATKKSK